MSDRFNPDRRNLLKLTGLGATGLLMSSAASAADLPGPSSIDTGSVERGKVNFPPWRAAADTPSAPTPAPLPPEQRVGFVIVGLGRLSMEEILPAFSECKKAKPVALVLGTPDTRSTSD